MFLDYIRRLRIYTHIYRLQDLVSYTLVSSRPIPFYITKGWSTRRSTAVSEGTVGDLLLGRFIDKKRENTKKKERDIPQTERRQIALKIVELMRNEFTHKNDWLNNVDECLLAYLLFYDVIFCVA